MANGQHFTRHQKGIVNRYYEHRDTIMLSKLGEAVSELYLCESEAKAAKLWTSVETALKNLKVEPARAAKIVAARDVKGLAGLLQELQAGG